ncbi:MAG: heparan-alpha-glucosaminide N-acetyltransferase domain-containing protein [Acidobacteriota bacterium]|nr:heparan-alpha-glucosaminide N-acetyltransferase domain-containing protein [Acidobacteriota bacterium]
MLTTATLPARAAGARLLSLDVFRGLTMAAMVIVNNPGDWSQVYGPLLHAPWHGLTPTDLIFPFFLFIAGVSITLAPRSSAGVATIARRAAVIFGLGMLLALYPRFDLAIVRIPGVLQRIAVCYLVVALSHRALAGRRSTMPPQQRIVITLASALALLAGYWGVMMLVPAPGAAAGDLSPEGNVGAAIDRWVFGPHLWRQSKTWDPEGLLSTVPAIGTTLTGLAAGYVLTSGWSSRDRTRALVIGSAVALDIGILWSFVFPLNKALWTSSYVLVTSGLAGLLLIALESAAQRFTAGFARVSEPLVALGRNALLLFVLSGFLAKTLALIRVDNGQGGTAGLGRWMYLEWFAPIASPKNASLLFALAHLLILFALLWCLHRRRLYLRV